MNTANDLAKIASGSRAIKELNRNFILEQDEKKIRKSLRASITGYLQYKFLLRKLKKAASKGYNSICFVKEHELENFGGVIVSRWVLNKLLDDGFTIYYIAHRQIGYLATNYLIKPYPEPAGFFDPMKLPKIEIAKISF